MRSRLFLRLGIAFLCSCGLMAGANPPNETINAAFAEGLSVDLRDPVFKDGVLSTEKGGVISTSDMRIQATNFTYTRKVIDGQPVTHVKASGHLLIEYGEQFFVGDHLEYDFQTKTGILTNGRTQISPWFMGANKVSLKSDGSFVLHSAYLSVCEGDESDWQVRSKSVRLYPNQRVSAKGVRFRFIRIPLLWMPRFQADLEGLKSPPFDIRFRWGGGGGARIMMRYHLASWRTWDVFLRGDVRLTHGPGAGIETEYESLDGSRSFLTRNFVAWDARYDDPGENELRWAFDGYYRQVAHDGDTTIRAEYHKLSDDDVDNDYREEYFDLQPKEYTEGAIHHRQERRIFSVYSRVRLNNFHSVKQEIPSFSGTWKPYELGKNTGIIGTSDFTVGYISWKFANELTDAENISAFRAQVNQMFYRPIHYRWINFIPTVEANGIYYGDSQDDKRQLVRTARGGIDVNTRWHKISGNKKHVCEPYANYYYRTYPGSSPEEHFVFDIHDAYWNMHTWKFGMRNLIYKRHGSEVSRLFTADIYANGFRGANAFDNTLPRANADFFYRCGKKLHLFLDGGWDFDHGEFSHYNGRLEWTVSKDLAFACEYRHRSEYHYRKLDPDNFMMENFLSEADLLATDVSDLRDTYLFHAFWRLKPNLALQVRSRHGRRRADEPNYNEVLVTLHTVLYCSWRVRLSYLHREESDRIAFNINLNRIALDKFIKPPKGVTF